MSKRDNIHFEKYKSLVLEIDHHTRFLEDIHRKYMKCKNGCDMCCIDFSILPLEYYFIRNELNMKNIKPENEENSVNNVCSFLRNHLCIIYNHRPIMCRTHGLPLIYVNEEGEFELSACELNFTEFDFEDFTMENTLPQDKYNSKLFMLNKEFIRYFKDRKFSEMDLIPMKQLALEFK